MSKQRLSLSFEQRKCFTPEPFSRKERNSPFPVPSHLSKGSLLLPSYVHHGHLSPYIGPKRNSKFVHPNITSHEAFYEFDYGYKNDLPNPRLLSPVKNDRFHSQERKRGRKPINTELDFSGLSERDEILSQRSHTTERDYFSETPRNKYDYNESVSSRSYMSQSDFNDRELSEFGRPREMLKKHRPQTEKKSRRTPLPSVKEEYEVTEKCYSSHEAHSVDYGHKSHLENGYQSVRQEKLKEQEMERDLLSPEWKNLSFSYDVERQLTVIRAKEAHEAKNQRILEQYRQKYGRPTGPYDGGVIIKALYDRQDEIDKQRKVTRDDLRSHNKRQMGIHKEKKEEERVDRLTSEFTSFQITGNEYYNPYIPSERRFVRDLEEQITDNKIRKMEENEINRQMDEMMIEADKMAVETIKQMKREKMENEKKIMVKQLISWKQAQEQAKERDNIEKSKEKYYAKQAYEEQKNREFTEELLRRSKQNVLQRSLQQHQDVASYKKRFEAKKQYYEGSGKSYSSTRQKRLNE